MFLVCTATVVSARRRGYALHSRWKDLLVDARTAEAVGMMLGL
ncbi:hypothetical protein [Corynebacterium pacaense]|nr:hypothetical protein [Corynebacterium pacaense]